MSDQSPYIPPVDPTLPQPVENVSTPAPTSSLAFLIKKMGGAKAMSTVLGMMLLAAGLGAGLILVAQPQLLGQKASDTDYICQPSDCSNLFCDAAQGGKCVGTKPLCNCVYVSQPPPIIDCTQVKCVKGPVYKRNSYCKGKNYISEYFYNMKCPTGYEKCAGDPIFSYKTRGTSQSCKDQIRCSSVTECPSADYTCYLPGTKESMCQYLPVN